MGQVPEPMLEPAPPARGDIEEWINDVGEGWRPLIRGLDVNLRDLDPDYIIGQVKEKFGGLRYYVDAFTSEYAEEADALVRAAEDISLKICEECGAPGEAKAIGGFLVKTLCSHCRRETEAARARR